MNLNEYQSRALSFKKTFNIFDLKRIGKKNHELRAFCKEMIILSQKFDRLKRVIFYNSKNWPEELAEGESRELPPNVEPTIQFIHGLLALCSDINELFELEEDRNIVFYKDNVLEEAGDLLWCLTEIVSAVGLSLEEVAAANIKKMSARYGDKFSEEKALTRDVVAEKAAVQTVVALGGEQIKVIEG